MLAQQRREEIAAMLRREGQVVVAEVAASLGITQETVRRDLDVLEQDGIARRVHGGAVAAAHASITEWSLPHRNAERLDAKRRIATLAASRLLQLDATSVLLDAGSTTGMFAAELASSWPIDASRRLVVHTHAPSIAQTLAAHPTIEVHTIGGRIRSVTGAAVGAQTVLAVQQLRPDVVVLGTNGITIAGLTTPDPEEAAVKQAIVAAGRRVTVLADASKLGAETLVRFAPITVLDALITDAEPEPALAAALDEAGCEVYTA